MITPKHKLDELKRELAMRQKCYPLWVTSGKIKKEVAKHRLEVLKSMIEDYQAKESITQQNLFES